MVPLPENRCMTSARVFAECRISSTRQRYYLPSAYQNALGERLTLGGTNLCRVPAIWHSASPLFAECWPVGTRQIASRAPHTPAHDRYGGVAFTAVIVCRVPTRGHSANTSLPSASQRTLGKHCHVHRTRPFPWPLPVATNIPILPRPLLFAECQLGNTRQKHASPSVSLGHSANIF